MNLKPLGIRGDRSQKQTVGNSKNSSLIQELLQQLELYELIFDSIHNGAVVTDASGYVTHFNRPYGHFLDLDPTDQIGRHCTEVLENTRMHIVAQTGQSEINRTHKFKGQNMVVQRIPIYKDGQVVAVFGQVMFKDVRDVHKLSREFSLLESKVQHYEAELLNLRATRYTFDSIMGKSEVICGLKREAMRAAGGKSPVLITGESGTGKELFAQAIHQAGNRKCFPFVRINCAAIPKELLESELFGYEKGAYTGALARGKLGKFELAHQGTIFLDEIGDLPLEMQPKLLRVLEDKAFERVGGNQVIRPDFRLIAASNQNLETMLRQGRFRKDLYYRLNVIRLDIPPLRERPEDIIELSHHLLTLLAEEANVPLPDIDASARRALIDYHWPGNVRELSNVLERSLAGMDGKMVRLADLPVFIYQKRQAQLGRRPAAIRDVQRKAEIAVIQSTIEACGGNKSMAARKLGIHRTLLYKKIKKYSLTTTLSKP